MSRLRVNKKDDFRALLTDTMPGDLPFIFSNDGLYLNLHKHAEGVASRELSILIERILMNKGEQQTSPYKYSIRKDKVSFRHLSLLHPRLQLRLCEFYNKFSYLITYLCDKSPASIRAPKKIGNSLYLKDKNINSKFKNQGIDTVKSEINRSYLSSFYSYGGYDKLYKFFNSARYLELEKKYTCMWMLDISNCFGSIYTHTVTWAVKSKSYAKKNIRQENQFACKFDRLMQRSNNNETNGIAIGSEVSRVFSEVILQEIDAQIIQECEERCQYSYGIDFEFVRYVDDYILFSNDEKLNEDVANIINDNLNDYNMRLNELKVKKIERPFITKKSMLISIMKDELASLDEKLFDVIEDSGYRRSYLKGVSSNGRLLRDFVNRIKRTLGLEGADYEDVANFIISIISYRAIKIIKDFRIITGLNRDELVLRYRDTLCLYVDLMFFFFTISPSVQSSYKLAKVIVLAQRFFNNFAKEFSSFFKSRVMEHYNKLEMDFDKKNKRKNHISVECLNILLATHEFGEAYSTSSDKLRKFIDEKPSYFEIISLLFYMRDYKEYDNLRAQCESIIENYITDESNLDYSSEFTHMFLDTICCPYVSDDLKKKLYVNFYKQQSIDLTENEAQQKLGELNGINWFVKWKNVDLVKMLKRKELITRY
ncbi:antiviral reverse transcriptase Drt3b [Pleionea sediminis]|uniref:antiviral reverse transcriptase Drt3b n=1 Tax=Pleionea sediminis TaxID=2569479 RepID=UPI00118517EA|nr:antiviral reverse transcriptase Drt3b [Pleionea sediminis]